jgi:hypothetical protein
MLAAPGTRREVAMEKRKRFRIGYFVAALIDLPLRRDIRQQARRVEPAACGEFQRLFNKEGWAQEIAVCKSTPT